MALDPNRSVNVAVQVLPLAADPYPLIERAVAVTPRPSIGPSWEGRGVIQASGVKHEVDPMETVMEGPLDQLLEVARGAHLACMEGGAEQAVTVIKIADRRSGTTIAGKVDRHRR